MCARDYVSRPKLVETVANTTLTSWINGGPDP